jgi:hypothetical protein
MQLTFCPAKVSRYGMNIALRKGPCYLKNGLSAPTDFGFDLKKGLYVLKRNFSVYGNVKPLR